MPFRPVLSQCQAHGAAPIPGEAILDFRFEYVRESFRQSGLIQRLIAQLMVKMFVECQVPESRQGEGRNVVIRCIFSRCLQQSSPDTMALMPVLDRQFDYVQCIFICCSGDESDAALVRCRYPGRCFINISLVQFSGHYRVTGDPFQAGYRQEGLCRRSLDIRQARCIIGGCLSNEDAFHRRVALI